MSFHIKTLEPRLGDDALSLRGGENDDTDYQNVFIPLSRDFPSTKPTGRWEVLQLARVRSCVYVYERRREKNEKPF